MRSGSRGLGTRFRCKYNSAPVVFRGGFLGGFCVRNYRPNIITTIKNTQQTPNGARRRSSILFDRDVLCAASAKQFNCCFQLVSSCDDYERVLLAVQFVTNTKPITDDFHFLSPVGWAGLFDPPCLG